MGDSIDAGEVTEDKSSEIVNKAEKKRQEPDISTTEEEEKGMAAPIAVSQSVKDWMFSRRENIRPITTFFNSANYQSNYLLVLLVLAMYCLISSPMLLMVIVLSGLAGHSAARRNKDRKLIVGGHEVSLAHQYGAIILCSLPLLVFAGARDVLFWMLGASLLTVSVHASFYNYDKLEVQGDQEKMVGDIVEEEV